VVKKFHITHNRRRRLQLTMLAVTRVVTAAMWPLYYYVVIFHRIAFETTRYNDEHQRTIICTGWPKNGTVFVERLNFVK